MSAVLGVLSLQPGLARRRFCQLPRVPLPVGMEDLLLDNLQDNKFVVIEPPPLAFDQHGLHRQGS